jgi:hypothetical protein
MKVGDLVIGNGLLFGDYGVGIIIGKKSGGLRVYWPNEGGWTSFHPEGRIKQITVKKCP